MFIEFLQSAGLIAGMFAAIAALFWGVMTLIIRRVSKPETGKSIIEEEQELEAQISAEIIAKRMLDNRASGSGA
jgi:hypothetical protein